MSYNYLVLKRSGQKTDYDVTKIRKVVNWAANSLNVNPLELESSFEMSLQDGITTRAIQQSLILGALRLTSLEDPDWKYVAGRLKLFDIYKEIAIRRDKHIRNIYDHYGDFLRESIENGIYTDVLLKKYSTQEIAKATTFIKPEYDLVYDYAGVNLLARRYLCEYKDALWELPQEMFLSIALLLEQNADSTNRLNKVKDTYEKIANRKISLATPILMNLRRPQGNLSSCFITAMDDTRKSIFYAINQIAAISQHGGGVGCNISRVRCKGARLRGIKNVSGGVIPWIRIINDTALAVNQQGKRKGAVTVSLDVWHMDIECFLELQTENGDQRMKAYDIFPQVVVPDLFMEKVLNNDEWLLVDPQEIRTNYGVEIGDLWGQQFTEFYKKLHDDATAGKLELYKLINAKELFKKIMKSQIETGMPYIAFKDTLNKYNPNKHDGVILGTNLCTESHSNIKPSVISDQYFDHSIIKQDVTDGLVHVCNLVSINLANVEVETEMESVCATAVRILDNAIDFTDVPVPEGAAHNRRYRTIGVGAMGLADCLAKHNIAYKDSATFVDELFERFALYTIRASIDIAREKGTFEAYKGSDWDKEIILGKDKAWFKNHGKHANQWMEIFDNLKQFGIRNSQLTAIAPNTSSSLLQGCTASILPVYSKFFIDNHGSGSIPNCPPFIKEKLWYYQENKHMNQKDVVDVVATINKWIDTGISMELVYNLNMGITAKDIFETIVRAWKQDIKTIYYTRSVQKDGDLSDKVECTSCAG